MLKSLLFVCKYQKQTKIGQIQGQFVNFDLINLSFRYK